MRFTPTNPLDSYHSQIEIENFLEERKEKKEFMESIKQMADSSKIESEIALKKSKQADIKGWIAVIVSVLTFILEICDRIGLF